jgi:hypothetical protein
MLKMTLQRNVILIRLPAQSQNFAPACAKPEFRFGEGRPAGREGFRHLR